MILIQDKIPNRYQWVDTLRGISAAMVLILHLWLIIKDSVSDSILKQIFTLLVFGVTDFGKIGVILFFFISGYLIPASLLRKSTVNFLKGRFYRLYPAYWFSIILFVVTTQNLDTITIIVNTTMFQKFLGFPDLIGVFWTLQIEWIFYILCIIFFQFGLFHKSLFSYLFPLTFIIMSLALALFRYYTDQKLPVALFLALSVMFIGMLLRFYEGKIVAGINKSNIILILIAFIILLFPITILAYNKDYGFQETWYRYYFSYLAAIFIFFLFYKYKLFFSVASFLGKISYSLYLLHPICIEFINHYYHYLKDNNLLLFAILCILISLIVSTLSYRFIEQRFIK